MVARLNFAETISTILDYNEQKVLQNVAELIHSSGFLMDASQLNKEEKAERFDRLNQLNPRPELTMLHATVNFAPGETLTKEQLSAIADRYMEGLRMQNQPFLVYQHYDAGHPHLHIVSSLTRADGTHIKTHNMSTELSEPTRKAIEQEFNLVRAGEQQERLTLSPEQVPKASYGESTGTKQAMRDILQMVITHYNFTNLEEYNAILKEYNVLADRGKPGSATYENNGLVYRVTDDDGKKKSAPVKASAYDFKPTLSNLEKQFEHNLQTREAQTANLRQKLDLAVFQSPASPEDFAADLRRDDISVHQTQQTKDPKTAQPPELIYVDHHLRIAIDARQLGPAYMYEQLQKAFDAHAQTQHLRQQQDLGKRLSR